MTFHSAGCSNVQASGTTILEKHISSNGVLFSTASESSFDLRMA